MSTKPRTSQQKHVRPPPPPPSAESVPWTPGWAPRLGLEARSWLGGLLARRGLEPPPPLGSPAQPPPGCRP